MANAKNEVRKRLSNDFWYWVSFIVQNNPEAVNNKLWAMGFQGQGIQQWPPDVLYKELNQMWRSDQQREVIIALSVPVVKNRVPAGYETVLQEFHSEMKTQTGVGTRMANQPLTDDSGQKIIWLPHGPVYVPDDPEQNKNFWDSGFGQFLGGLPCVFGMCPDQNGDNGNGDEDDNGTDIMPLFIGGMVVIGIIVVAAIALKASA